MCMHKKAESARTIPAFFKFSVVPIAPLVVLLGFVVDLFVGSGLKVEIPNNDSDDVVVVVVLTCGRDELGVEVSGLGYVIVAWGLVVVAFGDVVVALGYVTYVVVVGSANMRGGKLI